MRIKKVAEIIFYCFVGLAYGYFVFAIVSLVRKIYPMGSTLEAILTIAVFFFGLSIFLLIQQAYFLIHPRHRAKAKRAKEFKRWLELSDLRSLKPEEIQKPEVQKRMKKLEKELEEELEQKRMKRWKEKLKEEEEEWKEVLRKSGWGKEKIQEWIEEWREKEELKEELRKLGAGEEELQKLTKKLYD